MQHCIRLIMSHHRSTRSNPNRVTPFENPDELLYGLDTTNET